MTDTSDPDLLTWVENISCSGVLFNCTRQLRPMTRMHFALDLPAPAGKSITAEGVIVRCQKDPDTQGEFMAALLYTKLSDADYQAIEHFVEHDQSLSDK